MASRGPFGARRAWMDGRGRRETHLRRRVGIAREVELAPELRRGSSRTSARHERHTAAHRARARGGSMHNTCAARSCGRRSKCSARGSSSERRREGALSRRPRSRRRRDAPSSSAVAVRPFVVLGAPGAVADPTRAAALLETAVRDRTWDRTRRKNKKRGAPNDSPVQNARRRRRGRFPAEMITFEKSKRALSDRTRPDRIRRRPRNSFASQTRVTPRPRLVETSALATPRRLAERHPRALQHRRRHPHAVPAHPHRRERRRPRGTPDPRRASPATFPPSSPWS